MQAAGWTLLETVGFGRARAIGSNGESYPILPIAEAPVVEMHLIDRLDEPYLGAGEQRRGRAGAAVANPAANLVGLSTRRLPINARVVAHQSGELRR